MIRFIGLIRLKIKRRQTHTRKKIFPKAHYSQSYIVLIRLAITCRTISNYALKLIYCISLQLLCKRQIRSCMATQNIGTTNPATTQADETIHHLMEDIGDFVVCRTNNSSLVCTIYMFISTRDRKNDRQPPHCTFPMPGDGIYAQTAQIRFPIMTHHD